MKIIEVKHLSKDYKYKVKDENKGFFYNLIHEQEKVVKAVNNISFDVEEGETVAFIGPNGAGKSTTIKMLTGIIDPTKGNIKICGLTPIKDRNALAYKIGTVFGQRSQLWWDIPAEDTFDLLKDIYEIPEEEYQTTKKDLVNKLNLQDIINIPVRQLSLGQRMRCEIAASLLHNPKILFLDEPTIGLDAVSKQVVRDFIKKLNKEKKTTVILTSHDMADITSLAKRIILIGKGHVLYDGSLKILQNKYETEKYVSIKTNDILTINKKGIKNTTKTKYGYDLVIDTNEISISELLNIVSNGRYKTK